MTEGYITDGFDRLSWLRKWSDDKKTLTLVNKMEDEIPYAAEIKVVIHAVDDVGNAADLEITFFTKKTLDFLVFPDDRNKCSKRSVFLYYQS